MTDLVIKVIAFDLGQVMFFGSNPPFHKYLSNETGLSIQEVRALHKKAYMPATEIGEVSPLREYESLKSVLNLSSSAKELMELHINYLILNKKTLEFALSLKKKYAVGIISNCNVEAKNRFNESNIEDLFSPVIFSCEVGVMKPQKEIFELFLKKIHSKPENILFIDDKQENIDSAKALGFNAIKFTSIEQVIKEAEEKYGVSP